MSEESDRGARRYDAIVVGAGMSGLAAGIRLAQFDRRVVVLEKHEVWGGLNSFYGKDGHRFDVGLHALTNYVPRGTRGAPLTSAGPRSTAFELPASIPIDPGRNDSSQLTTGAPAKLPS